LPPYCQIESCALCVWPPELRTVEPKTYLETPRQGVGSEIQRRNSEVDRNLLPDPDRSDPQSERSRDALRYQNCPTDSAASAQTGRHRAGEMHAPIDVIFRIRRGGRPWRMLPGQFAPHETACRWFMRFRDDGTWESLNRHLVRLDRKRVGREAAPVPR
jgi:putative transposase